MRNAPRVIVGLITLLSGTLSQRARAARAMRPSRWTTSPAEGQRSPA